MSVNLCTYVTGLIRVYIHILMKDQQFYIEIDIYETY